jgi:hypothetical protein
MNSRKSKKCKRSCSPKKLCNSRTGRCVFIKGRTGRKFLKSFKMKSCKKPCSSKKVCNPLSGKCVAVNSRSGKKVFSIFKYAPKKISRVRSRKSSLRKSPSKSRSHSRSKSKKSRTISSLSDIVNTKIDKLLEKHGSNLKDYKILENIKADLLLFLNKLSAKDLILVLDYHDRIKYFQVMPDNTDIFIKSNSKTVCIWLIENTDLEYPDILDEYIENENPPKWKKDLANEWIQKSEYDPPVYDEEDFPEWKMKLFYGAR